MLLKKPSELKEKKNFKCLIYGQPGVGKTTLALSAKNPVLFDFEEGIYRVEQQYQVPSLQVNNFSEVEQVLNSNEIDEFDTIVFDTLGKFIDCIVDAVKVELKRTTLRVQDWGNVKNKFNNIIKTSYAKNKNIIFVAHETEDKEDDVTRKRPNTGSGSGARTLINDMDLVGYMFVANKQRCISFTPSDNYYAKNTLQLDDVIVVENPKIKGNIFLAEKIFGIANETIKKNSEIREKYDALLEITKGNIDNFKTIEEFNNFMEEFKNYEVIWDSKFRIWDYLVEKAKTNNFTFNKLKKTFEK